MNRMLKQDPKLLADQQDKRRVVAIGQTAVDQWLAGKLREVVELLAPPVAEMIDSTPKI